MRYKELYNDNKECYIKLSSLVAGISRINEKRQNVERLMLWLLSHSLLKLDSSSVPSLILSEIQKYMTDYKIPPELVCSSLNELIESIPTKVKKTMTIRIHIDNNELEISKIARDAI